MTKPLAMTVGRRKTSVVRVRLRQGTGKVVLNGRALEAYFPTMANRLRVLEPIKVAGVEGRYDVEAKLEGGGVTAMSGGRTPTPTNVTAVSGSSGSSLRTVSVAVWSPLSSSGR